MVFVTCVCSSCGSSLRQYLRTVTQFSSSEPDVLDLGCRESGCLVCSAHRMVVSISFLCCYAVVETLCVSSIICRWILFLWHRLRDAFEKRCYFCCNFKDLTFQCIHLVAEIGVCLWREAARVISSSNLFKNLLYLCCSVSLSLPRLFFASLRLANIGEVGSSAVVVVLFFALNFRATCVAEYFGCLAAVIISSRLLPDMTLRHVLYKTICRSTFLMGFSMNWPINSQNWHCPILRT